MSNGSRLAELVRHPLSVAGIVVTTLSAILFLVFFLLDLLGFTANPYLGILVFLVAPGLFLIGLVLIPCGIGLERRRRRKGLDVREAEWPSVDLNVPHQRRVVAFVLVSTVLNLVILSLAAYRGLEYMDSVEFCGELCHTVMEPEFVAYQDGPHARVTCVQCHIGPGAPWFVKSKLSGTRQVFAVTFGTYSRPIPTPVENLRPARDTCEQCHWPEKFHGDQLTASWSYADDEASTESPTMLRLHVGGMTPKAGKATGIHWHVDPANAIDYIAIDEKRQVIGKVTLRDGAGRVVREWIADGVTPGQLAAGESRRMDCIDCHNRPTHPFAASAGRAVDAALGREELTRGLPYIRREAVAALSGRYATREQAVSAISDRIARFYRENYPEVFAGRRAELDGAIASAQRVYARNVFPTMGVGWGTHLNNLGHTDSPGCFRCHDDIHRDREGATISQDCSLCHTIE